MKIFTKSRLIVFIFCTGTLMQIKKHPNVVAVIVDQFKVGSTDFNSNKEVSIPNIDNLTK